MHEISLLVNISVALVAAFISGVIARRLGLPTIIGYLLAGIIIGPFTPGFVGDTETIQQLAELGVIFLMFGVGLHFSFSDLWRVRTVAVRGALLQTAAATLLGILLTQLWGWTISSGILLGLSISVASTVVLLRGLIDHSLLNTSHGQTAVGWLVMEDILSVLILVLMPAIFSGSTDFNWTHLLITLAKAALFVIIMAIGGARLIPWLLVRIAHTRSRELFILATLAIALGTAVGAAELFGVSLALGAFVAGAIISQSELGHQVSADVFAFREAFSALFFLSVGMLVNPTFLVDNLGQVAALTALVVIGKAAIVILIGLLIPKSARTYLIVAIGLSQIGEFTFILGQGGVSIGLLSTNQYSLILATALISITINPFLYQLLPKLERVLQLAPGVWARMNPHIPEIEAREVTLQEHVVIVGYGRLGTYVVNVLQAIGIPHLVIEHDAQRVEQLNQQGTLTLFGDPANSEVITHAGLDRARALVVTVPEETASEMIVAAAQSLAPELPIIVRASTEAGVERLTRLGAKDVIHPELEGGLEILRHTLLRLGLPLKEINSYTDTVRKDHYDLQVNTEVEHRLLHRLLSAVEGIEIVWFELPEGHALNGQTIREAHLRARTGASIVAVLRNGKIIANPKSGTRFEAGDQIGVIGEMEQIESLVQLIGVESL